MKKAKSRRGNVANLTPIKKGEHPVGRVKGTPNKFTRDIKEAIIRAAELSEHSETKDLVGYMVYLADQKQETFAHLLGRLIPVQAKHTVIGMPPNINMTLNMPLAEMIQNFEQRIKAAVIPREPLLLEHEAEEQDA